MTKALSTVPRSIGICDDSGLCDVAQMGAPERRVDVKGSDLLLVDVSPISLGHCLVVPKEHVTDSLALSRLRSQELWKYAGTVAATVERELRSPVAILEHGIAPDFEGPACVRHAHIHVCPIVLPSDLPGVLASFLSDVRFAHTFDAAAKFAHESPSHVLGRVGKAWFAGSPNGRHPQISRAILHSMAAAPPASVDWMLGALGPLYRESMKRVQGWEFSHREECSIVAQEREMMPDARVN